MTSLNMEMLQRLFKKKKRAMQIFPDDVFLVSYPKSGNTWVRFMLGNYLTDNSCDFDNSHLIVPDVHFNPVDCEKLPRPRVIKSHFQYTADYPKVVYLVRDGRDVAVSYYYHQKKYGEIDAEASFSTFMEEFNSGQTGSFGLWGEHVLSWVNHKQDDMLVIRYEDLKEDPVHWFSVFLTFCGMPAQHEKVLAAIEASSMKNMQSMENRQQDTNILLANSDKAIPFVRKGESMQWVEYFNESLLHDFMLCHGKAIKKMGYK